MPQLKLETNIPVIFLTLLVIAVVVLGYLEFKKLNERIKVLEYLNKEKEKKKEGNNDIENNTNEIKNVGVTPIIPKSEIKEELPRTNNMLVEEWQMNNEKENIINTINKKEEYIEEIDEEEKTFFNPDEMYPGNNPPHIMYRMMDETDDIIERIKNDEDINFENASEEEIINNMGMEGLDKSERFAEIGSDNGSDNGSGSESSVGSNEQINLKEISDEDDFSKDKISVDESYSVNQLKAICKNLGLQLSGNKTTLIKRIMDNQ